MPGLLRVTGVATASIGLLAPPRHVSFVNPYRTALGM
jgi:hypothetical protein